MPPPRVSHLTASGRQTPCSPSWRVCDYADKLSHGNQRCFAIDAVQQLRRGIIRQSALCLRTGVEEGDPAQEKCLVLPHDQWSPRRRSFHEPDSHCRTVRRKSVRLSHGVTAASPRTGASARELDALELPGKPCSGDGYCRLSGKFMRLRMLAASSQFITEIDGLDIHFIHV